MNQLHAGFGRVNVTPKMGIEITGYWIDRRADGVLDELEINALALACGEQKAVLLSMDTCSLRNHTADIMRAYVAKVTGLSLESIYFHATHTHTGAQLIDGSDDPLLEEYFQFVKEKLAEVTQIALADLKPAQMGFGVGRAPNIAFVRRYRMKDGSVRTNPGVNNPDILAPIGQVDERINVLRFDREGADTLVLANFGCHPDTVGGCKISGDWPTLMRASFEKAVDNTRCIFFNGAQGDINHVNVHPKGGDLNGMFMDFDDVSRGYPHTLHMGRVVAAGVMQVYDKVQYVDVESIRCMQRLIKVPANKPKPEEMEEAYYIQKMHADGRDAELPYKGMMLTTMLADSARKIRLEHAPDAFDMNLSVVAIGNVAMIGVPGEPFTGIGLGFKQAQGWDLILPTCTTNGALGGYFPMRDSYEDGGYEARQSNFAAGVAELMIEEGLNLLAQMRG